MASVDEQILRAAKEMAVKFIETGRVSPAAFPDLFRNIYWTVDETVKAAVRGERPGETGPESADD
jgi:hypothetical protein